MDCFVIFAHELLDFRQDELNSLRTLHDIAASTDGKWNTPNPEDTCIYRCSFPSEEDAITVARRSMTIRGVYEFWGQGETIQEVHDMVKLIPMEKRQRYHGKDVSFSVQVQGFNVSLSMEKQYELREAVFDYQDVHGTINLKNPQATFLLLVERLGDKFIYTFGRELSLSQRIELRNKYDLKKRGFLCSTSMSAEQAFLVANFAHAAPGKLIVDPFCGSGSLLVSCAHFGASTMGGELDWRVLTGKSNSKQRAEKGKTIWTNFQDYGLPVPLDLIRCDMGHVAFRAAPIFDAIVCDPPYGIRAGARKTGSTKETVVVPPIEREPTVHFPQTIPYAVQDVLSDLIDFAAKRLVIGGRLVYWLPSTDEYHHEDLPSHPCLKLLYNNDELLSLRWRRRLITMEKTRDWEEGMKTIQTIPEGRTEPAHANIASKILRVDAKTREERDSKKKQRRSGGGGARGEGGGAAAAATNEEQATETAAADEQQQS